jgi:hypothetical protein
MNKKSQDQEDDEEEFEKHVPVHPLPEEIQKMKKDETVCQFCGVSYLIHREIKKLEDRVKVLFFRIIRSRILFFYLYQICYYFDT